jgi:hypothetical protein
MTVLTICDRCGMEYTWPGVTAGGRIYCCEGCATGGLCTCPTAVVADGTTVMSDGTVVVPGNDVVIVE